MAMWWWVEAETKRWRHGVAFEDAGVMQAPFGPPGQTVARPCSAELYFALLHSTFIPSLRDLRGLTTTTTSKLRAAAAAQELLKG